MVWIVTGCISAFISVSMGAFGAHALSSVLSPRNLEIYQTAVHYQVIHALALILLGIWNRRSPVAGWAFICGTVLFSGSLYALALSDIRALGLITPFGGVAFLVGWLAFARAAYLSRGHS